jgi:hypothetical protein
MQRYKKEGQTEEKQRLQFGYDSHFKAKNTE